MRLPIVCPFCGYHGSHVGGVNAAGPPAPGDVSLCLGCGEFSIFFGASYVRKPTAKEAAEFAADPDLITIKEQWRATVAAHGRPTGGYKGSKVKQ